MKTRVFLALWVIFLAAMAYLAVSAQAPCEFGACVVTPA